MDWTKPKALARVRLWESFSGARGSLGLWADIVATSIDPMMMGPNPSMSEGNVQ